MTGPASAVAWIQAFSAETSRPVLLQGLARAASDPALTLFEFCAVTSGLRMALRTPADLYVHVIESLRARLLSAAERDWTRLDPSILTVVTRLEAAGKNALHLSEGNLASQLGLKPKALSKSLKSQLGLSFRPLRRTVVMRRALPMLAGTDEQVAQIAYAVGYDDQSSFDHSFQRLLGISPTGFRKLLGGP